jgi:hypothetical protein
MPNPLLQELPLRLAEPDRTLVAALTEKRLRRSSFFNVAELFLPPSSALC